MRVKRAFAQLVRRTSRPVRWMPEIGWMPSGRWPSEGKSVGGCQSRSATSKMLPVRFRGSQDQQIKIAGHDAPNLAERSNSLPTFGNPDE